MSEDAPQTLTEALVGPKLLAAGPLKRWRARSPTTRILTAMSVLAALIFVPFLGAVGLWDPWETHYGEVAREMVQRRDYVYPFWENAWFFSKPPLTMWLQALGMQVVGALRTDGALGRYTEWGMRVPFALLSIAAVALLSLAVARASTVRAGLAAGFVLATMPLYFLLTRQTVTDTPFVTTLVLALACAIIGQLDATTRHRAAWWYAFYVFCGLATLAKGLLGVGLPAVILFLFGCFTIIPLDGASWSAHLRWLVEPAFRAEVRAGRAAMPALWAQCFRMRLGTGTLVFFAVAAPWYLTLSLFEGVDDEGKLFWYRFFIHDHFNRLGAGVHTTTPGGTFAYFIEQGGFAIFPWVALVPGALAIVSRLKPRTVKPAEQLAWLAALWVGFTFLLLGASATKFHHYVFPILPGLAILIALFIDRLWEEGIGAHAGSLVAGLVLFILVGKDLANTPKHFPDLFVYNYDRAYPLALVSRPLALVGTRMLWTGDLLTVVLLSLGISLAIDAFTAREKSVSARGLSLLCVLAGAALLVSLVGRGSVSPLLMLGLASLSTAAYVALAARTSGPEERRSAGMLAVGLLAAGAGLTVRGLRGGASADPLLASLTQQVDLRSALGFAFAVAGVLAAVAAIQRSRVMLFGTFSAFALGFALWFSWSHWVDLSHHWTQRDLFWRYYDQRREGEPITAFLMNWRGETFYSRNTVKQIKDNGLMGRYAAQPGREWALVEHSRLGILRTAVGADRVVTPVDRDINNKFLLVTID